MLLRAFPIAILAIVLISACGGAPASAVTAQQVIDALNAGGATVANVAPGNRPPDSPLPNTFREHLSFSIEEVAPSGGQVFVCETKQNCDALFAYFDALKGLGGPYFYQSPSGTVVVQLNSGLTPDTAAKFESVVKGLP